MLRSPALWMLCLALSFVSGPALARDARSPLHGTLVRGPHDVGFTRMRLADPTRPARPKRDVEAADEMRARRIDVHVWYPAAPGSAARSMTFAEAMIAHLEDPKTGRCVRPTYDGSWVSSARSPMKPGLD